MIFQIVVNPKAQLSGIIKLLRFRSGILIVSVGLWHRRLAYVMGEAQYHKIGGEEREGNTRGRASGSGIGSGEADLA